MANLSLPLRGEGRHASESEHVRVGGCTEKSVIVIITKERITLNYYFRPLAAPGPSPKYLKKSLLGERTTVVLSPCSASR